MGPDDTLYGVPVEGMAKEDDIVIRATLSESAKKGINSEDTQHHIAPEVTAPLGEEENDYSLQDDTLCETKVVGSLAGDTLGETKFALGEASLEEIEEDVNLDTSGSVSELFDLSLQADDTSLGSILDEIYTPEEESHSKAKSKNTEDSRMEKKVEVRAKKSRRFLLTRRIWISLLSKRHKPAAKAEKWLLSLSFWIPRKFREYVIGDILEDCDELRQLGYREWRVRANVLWQLTIAVIMLWPELIGSAIGTAVRRVLNKGN